LFIFTKSHAEDKGSQLGRLLTGTLVVAAQQLGQLLVVVENEIGVAILAWHCVRPQLLHEEDLVGELRIGSISYGSRLLNPVGQMAYKVEEEITLGYRDDLVCNLHKQGEALAGAQR